MLDDDVFDALAGPVANLAVAIAKHQEALKVHANDLAGLSEEDFESLTNRLAARVPRDTRFLLLYSLALSRSLGTLEATT